MCEELGRSSGTHCTNQEVYVTPLYFGKVQCPYDIDRLCQEFEMPGRNNMIQLADTVGEESFFISFEVTLLSELV